VRQPPLGYHCGIAFLTLADVHFGRASAILARRARTLDAAFAANPARFKEGASFEF
jgi:hypothetical protein